MGIFFTARWEARRVPGVKVAPLPLMDYSVSNAPGTPLSYFGYAFEVPWYANFKQKVFGKSGIVQLEFESGQNVTLFAADNQRGLLSDIVQDKSMHMENMQLILGDLTNRSPYDQYAALLSTTPHSIRAFGPRAEGIRGVTLLTIKAIAFPPAMETGVFSFELPDKHGFQIGDPRKSRRVNLELFGMGGHQVEIVCAATKDNISLSQPELNRILASFHAVLSEPAASPPAHLTGMRN